MVWSKCCGCSIRKRPEVPLETIAEMIECKDEKGVGSLISTGTVSLGYSVMMMASMHARGSWVINKFGTNENINEETDVNLDDLVRELGLRVDPEVQDDIGYTPLHFAVMFGPAKNVQCLIQKGANVNAKTLSGINPRQPAMW
eukprot:CAMPEP_0114487190 /NCGR_PEP_ID=MMETSP0109-20121206/631_1 /TAXON_ID=29199 /ORGANISM="Chlorarachnion reptans, Strain CCCM449" /LENGTH=142 /DNA_ID=CAMNT_0001663433 /DNA_START=130 /DNA_END=555 /DNA_ORIENTATION=-